MRSALSSSSLWLLPLPLLLLLLLLLLVHRTASEAAIWTPTPATPAATSAEMVPPTQWVHYNVALFNSSVGANAGAALGSATPIIIDTTTTTYTSTTTFMDIAGSIFVATTRHQLQLATLFNNKALQCTLCASASKAVRNRFFCFPRHGEEDIVGEIMLKKGRDNERTTNGQAGGTPCANMTTCEATACPEQAHSAEMPPPVQISTPSRQCPPEQQCVAQAMR